MSNYDWTRFKKRISIRSSVADVYEQWATAAGMENWFLRKCVIADYSGAEKPGNELIERFVVVKSTHPLASVTVTV